MEKDYTQEFKDTVDNFIIPAIESYIEDFDSGGYTYSGIIKNDSEGLSCNLVSKKKNRSSYVLKFYLKHKELNQIVCEAIEDNNIIYVFLEVYPITHLRDLGNIKLILSQALIRMQSVPY